MRNGARANWNQLRPRRSFNRKDPNDCAYTWSSSGLGSGNAGRGIGQKGFLAACLRSDHEVSRAPGGVRIAHAPSSRRRHSCSIRIERLRNARRTGWRADSHTKIVGILRRTSHTQRCCSIPDYGIRDLAAALPELPKPGRGRWNSRRCASCRRTSPPSSARRRV